MDIEGLSPHAHEVAIRVLADEATRREHVVVALSGAHAYGFPSPDSDLDLKAAHMDATETFLGLPRPASGCERLEVVDAVEIDYSSNEIGGVVAGVLLGNGNYIERILGPLLLVRADDHEELAALTSAALSKKVYRHYLGFATSQRVAFDKRGPTAKRLLYVLRTLLTGIHLLRSGELRVPLPPNAIEYGIAGAAALIEAKRAGENALLDDALAETWRGRLDGLFARLALARDESALAEAADPVPLEAWLVRRRVAGLDRGASSLEGESELRNK